MARKKTTRRTFANSSLRERAETLLRTEPEQQPSMSTVEVQKLIHELNVHQIELEVQNEELRQAQVELSQARDRFSDLYDFAPVGYITLDKQGQILGANLAAAHLLGFERKILISKNLSDFVNRNAQDEFYLYRQAIYSSKEKQVCELSMHNQGGRNLNIYMESIMFEEDGEQRSRTTLIDVSMQKAAMSALRKLNIYLGESLDDRSSKLQHSIDQVKLLTQAVANLDEGVLITESNLHSPGGPRIVFVNAAMCRISGYTAYDLIGHSPQMLQGPETDPQSLDYLKNEITGGRSCRVELINYRKNKTSYEIEQYVTPLLDDAGKVTHFVAIQCDISQRKQAERALKESEERKHAILYAAADAIVTVNSDGVISEMNPAAETMFGYNFNELIGQNITLVIPPLPMNAFSELIEHTPDGSGKRSRVTRREIYVHPRDNSSFPSEVTINRVDHLNLFSLIIRDISERKELQRHVLNIAADEQRRIGHELHDNTGQELTGLSLFAGTLLNILNEAAENDHSTEGRWTFADSEYQQIQKIAARLSQGLQEANRHVQELSHGIMPVQIDAQGLRVALEVLAETMNQQQQIHCQFHCDSTIEFRDNTTSTQLYRIAQESLNNALRHGHASQVNISLLQEGNQITLEVSDNGRGIDPIALQNRTSQRSGKGLDIMEYRANIIGGEFYLSNKQGGGTLVRCRVPQSAGSI
ncbi:PAS domain S-box protein [Gimesia sp.]|uniref:sensor histidine kinase n=1 Tax=Gimesia sp. TaxID=2024833 RepID=UPI003A93816B